MFISVLIERNIIAPLCVLIFINLLFYFKGRFKKIGIAVITLCALFFVELLAAWIGIKIYQGWNMYLDVAASLVLMIFSTLLALGVKKIK
jgi:apolipoprotein N-acyltransferase